MDKILTITELIFRVLDMVSRAIESGVAVSDRLSELSENIKKMKEAGREPTESELAELEAKVYSHNDEIQRRIKEIQKKATTKKKTT